MGDPVSTALLVGSAALSTASGIGAANGDYAAAQFKADQADEAARRGKIAAAQTDTALRDELGQTIANIRSIRASSGIDPASPTTDAIIANESRISEHQRRIQVGNILDQSQSDATSADFLRKSSRDAWLYGSIGAFARGAGTLSRI